MPYITQEARDRLLGVNGAAPGLPMTPGELNYVITKALASYFDRMRGSISGYQAINDCLGALSGADYEFKRRVVKPYEKLKCQENGDVYFE
jgi:hypothetical protein